MPRLLLLMSTAETFALGAPPLRLINLLRAAVPFVVAAMLTAWRGWGGMVSG
jgi:hypothetical protein